jgi:hypothetical protein
MMGHQDDDALAEGDLFRGCRRGAPRQVPQIVVSDAARSGRDGDETSPPPRGREQA